MNLVQFTDESGARRLAEVRDGGATLRVLADWPRAYDLARCCLQGGHPIASMVSAAGTLASVSFDSVLASGRVLTPLDHVDPAHCLVSGTGLTHLGSAQARDAMHARLSAAADDNALTDSLRLFRAGLAGGKPADGSEPVQPEWFYKGDGGFLVAPEHALECPAFADDGGEEPELAGLYVIGDDGAPFRVGFALGNEFSDHAMERKNYLYLAHSKLRNSSIGPELFVGELPAAIAGRSRLLRGGREIWSAPFLTGEANMSYTFAGLEHHHFKYRQFRRPGDVRSFLRRLHAQFFRRHPRRTGRHLRNLRPAFHAAAAESFGRPPKVVAWRVRRARRQNSRDRRSAPPRRTVI